VALVFNVANGFWLPLLRARQVPTVVNVDGIEWRRAKWNRLAKTVFRLGARASAKWATRLVCDSSAIADFWAAELGRGGEVIAYGADSPETDLPVEPGLAHRAYALVVARFVPENSIPEFFEAAPAIARQHDVVIVGSGAGELDAQAAALADANPRIRWLGHIADDRRLFSLWQHAGAYFHGHSVGGTNPALVQAMACGAPTVARDTVFTREVLADAGRFTSPEPTAIAQAVTALLSDPDAQDQLSARAVRRAHEAYSWARINSQYDQLLRQALDS
jgi:glycosyltransferase involved in cell wall biosynthesis